MEHPAYYWDLEVNFLVGLYYVSLSLISIFFEITTKFLNKCFNRQKKTNGKNKKHFLTKKMAIK